jgi:sugar phosphate isomerase/epimerase
LLPGYGKIDWNKFLRDLIEVPFRGALILEMADNADPAVTMVNARRGRTYFAPLPAPLTSALPRMVAQFLRS